MLEPLASSRGTVCKGDHRKAEKDVYKRQGKMLYNYGIEGVSYDMVDGTAVLKPVMVANGFVDYRSLGCEFEPFGGEW